MEGKKELVHYETQAGIAPFEVWLENLRDSRARYAIRARLDRLRYGYTGKRRFVGSGIFELKFFFGPGYRVYYGEEGDRIVILLCGGDKSTQTRDIRKAYGYWKDHKVRK